MNKRIVNITLLLAFLCASLVQGRKPDCRLLVSVDALYDQDPYSAFYNSRIFAGEKDVPFYIRNASDVPVFTDSFGTIFFSEDTLSENLIINAKKQGEAQVASILIGPSYVALMPSPDKNVAVKKNIAGYLGASEISAVIETRIISNKKILALFMDKKKADWPKSISELSRIPAVILSGLENNNPIMAFARPVGAFANKMSVVDALLKKDQECSSYIDLGSSGAQGSLKVNSSIITQVRKRNPSAILAGTREMMQFLKGRSLEKEFPFVFPLGNMARKNVNNDGNSINLWSLAGKENIWQLFKSLGPVQRVDASQIKLREAKETQNHPLNIVRVFSEQAAAEAAKSTGVDAVLMVANTSAILPSIEIKRFGVDSLSQGPKFAPIIRCSPGDISEIIFNGSEIKVRRHNVTEDSHVSLYTPMKKKKNSEVNALPGLIRNNQEVPYDSKDFNNILGGMIIDHTKADVAVFEDSDYSTNILGPINNEIAFAKLKRPGVISTTTINGRQLKKLLNLNNKEMLEKNYVFFGANDKAKTIRERAINDNEKFKVAFSESALLAAYNVALLGGLNEDYAIRAIFVESIYGKITNLWFVSGPKTMITSDATSSLEEAIKDLKAEISFEKLIKKKLASSSHEVILGYVDNSYGKRVNTISFNINNIDIGFSKNIANNSYENSGGKFPQSRGGVPLYAHALLLSNVGLNFDLKNLIINIGNSAKYLHTNFDKKPERDKVTFNVDFKLPFERSVFKDKSVVISPIWKNTYETKIFPIVGLSKMDDKHWQKERVLPRVKLLDSLLGTELAFKNLGFSIDLGAMMAVDFNQSNVRNSLDFGPGFNFDGKWALFGPVELSSKMLGYYLFGLPGNTAVNKAALDIEGTIWLRVARINDFSVSMMSDFFIASLQKSPKDIALSSILGLTISYGSFFRLLN